MHTTRPRGFTLIEMMITVAVIGILAAIAYPSYASYMVKSNRAAAQAHLMEIADKQAQYLIDNRAYAGTVAALGLSTPAKVASLYNVSITLAAGNPPGYTATAAVKPGTPQTADQDLAITHTGAKTPAAKW